jgi:hypothetical protein
VPLELDACTRTGDGERLEISTRGKGTDFDRWTAEGGTTDHGAYGCCGGAKRFLGAGEAQDDLRTGVMNMITAITSGPPGALHNVPIAITLDGGGWVPIKLRACARPRSRKKKKGGQLIALFFDTNFYQETKAPGFLQSGPLTR